MHHRLELWHWLSRTSGLGSLPASEIAECASTYRSISLNKIFYSIAPLEVLYAVLFVWLENNRPAADLKVIYTSISQVQNLNEEENDPQSDRNRGESINEERPE